jgi:hypothetical protein
MRLFITRSLTGQGNVDVGIVDEGRVYVIFVRFEWLLQPGLAPIPV